MLAFLSTDDDILYFWSYPKYADDIWYNLKHLLALSNIRDRNTNNGLTLTLTHLIFSVHWDKYEVFSILSLRSLWTIMSSTDKIAPSCFLIHDTLRLSSQLFQTISLTYYFGSILSHHTSHLNFVSSLDKHFKLKIIESCWNLQHIQHIQE